ncbi:hypothetical protein BGP_4402 [Beggiatoa sp. PS]|nr:hypothetical protein BGP_4402 [Beggiatoa sp. PS]
MVKGCFKNKCGLSPIFKCNVASVGCISEASYTKSIHDVVHDIIIYAPYELLLEKRLHVGKRLKKCWVEIRSHLVRIDDHQFVMLTGKKMGESAREIRKMKRECKDGDSEIDQFFNEIRALEQLQ